MKRNFLLLIVYILISYAAGAQTSNTIPTSSVFLNNKPIYLSQTGEILLHPGSAFNLQINTTDPDNDSIKITSNITSVLIGSVFYTNNAKQQSAFMSWVPMNSDVNTAPYNTTIQIEDDHTPLRGRNTFILKIRVAKPINVTLNTSPFDPNHEVTVSPGDILNFSINTSNPATLDSVKITSNVASVLPNATFNLNNAKQQTATIDWIPTIADVNNNPYLIGITVSENGMAYTFNLKIKVKNSNINSVKSESVYQSNIIAFPNPFTDQVSFKFNVNRNTDAQLIIYTILGTEVERINLNNKPTGEQEIKRINTSNYSAGQYIARLISENKQTGIIKFIKE